MAKSLMSESLQLVHNYATTGDHSNERSALLEEVESMLDEYKDALEPRLHYRRRGINSFLL